MNTSSNREIEWKAFSQLVQQHVREYTVPQYGDAPDDEVEEWTPEMCVKAISKYAKRFGKNRRGEQEMLLDMKKIAHFACLAHSKMVREEMAGQEEGACTNS